MILQNAFTFHPGKFAAMERLEAIKGEISIDQSVGIGLLINTGDEEGQYWPSGADAENQRKRL
jgi:hypothetical protein